ncbi:hypothetical protein ABEG18_13045 [Alsobacter sp. KACC 23698]|uniref:Phage neck terminator protein gp12-like domain-containing protein n=1 Tax=Alsobacter sp. KACC 23698 TaxID=3149229 RepID=A0AAU7JMJ9_9HYPH
MTEDAAFDLLQAYLTKVDADAAAITPERVGLVEINRAHQSAPRPASGAYAVIYLLTDRDLLEVDCEVYEDRTIGGEPRVVMKKARGIEWLFRLEVFASRPTDCARLFQAALRSAHASVELSPLVVRQVGEITRVPELKQEGWEGKAALDIALAGIAIDNLLVDVVESGSITFKGLGGADVNRLLTFAKD